MLNFNTLFPRVDTTESKIADLNILAKELKQSIPPSAEHMEKDMKNIKLSFNKYKQEQVMVIVEIKEMIVRQNIQKNLQALEAKIIVR
mmetsp:Transcript_6794/g.10953  ORF Transcript_6794/g.10953 Transcript_6794/m.10953 type:complete len:88 (-) Transcript_6794:1362-1625(-)